MRSKLTKEVIIDTTLELMRHQNDLSSLNLREIARKLGYAHTNLYNYFSSYNALLWEAHAAIQEYFSNMLIKRLAMANGAELKIFYFFEAFIDMYLDNKGWFRLAWMEYIGGERPMRDIAATEAVNQTLRKQLSIIWEELTGKKPSMEQLRRILHNTHCYIIGEISNHLLGRGLIDDEVHLRAYIANEATRIFKLCMKGA